MTVGQLIRKGLFGVLNSGNERHTRVRPVLCFAKR